VVHGDLHDRNILLDGGRLALLDSDTLHVGDPAVDVGNLAAHVFLRGLQSQAPITEAARSADAFRKLCDGHRGDADDGRSRHALVRALLRLGALYAFRRRWRHLVPTLLAAAADWRPDD